MNFELQLVSDVSDDILVPSGNSVEQQSAAVKMEFVTKLKTFAMDLKTRLLPYVLLCCPTCDFCLCLHCVPKKTCDYIFYNNFNNKCPITIIFGIVSSKSMSHRKMVSFPTSPI